jgi:hypothetical protein
LDSASFAFFQELNRFGGQDMNPVQLAWMVNQMESYS